MIQHSALMLIVGTPFYLYPIIRQESDVESYEEIMPNISIESEHIESELT